MRNICLTFLIVTISLVNFSAFSQTEDEVELLGLPGDNLDLFAVLDLFQKSKTIEDFEKSLNDKDTGINNLDLNDDEKVDFIKVETNKDGDDFLFVLQDAISETETQDVAVISVAKDKDGKVTMQIIGDEELYGKDYVIEPATKATPSVTANPAYTGDDPVTVNVPATTKVVVVESTPIVRYVYSPVYVPYYPPYYWGFYPPYFRPFPILAISLYRHHTWHRHYGYYGGYRGNTTIIINRNTQINHYHKNKRNTSTTVRNNISNGRYNTAGLGNRAKPGSRPTTSPGTKPVTRPATNPSTRPTTRPTTSPTTKPVTKPTTRPTTSPTTKPATRPTTRPTTSPTTKPATRPTTRPTTSPSARPTTSPSARPAARPSTNYSGSRSRASGSSYSRPSSMGSMNRSSSGGSLSAGSRRR